MIVKHGNGTTEFGPGVDISLTGDEVATAIDAYLVAHGVHVTGPRTVSVNGARCKSGRVYVDPSGFAIVNGERLDGRGDQPSRLDDWDNLSVSECIAEVNRAMLGNG